MVWSPRSRASCQCRLARGPGPTYFAVGRIRRGEHLQRAFADRQIKRLTSLFEGLQSGRAEVEGEDPECLLGLTEMATTSKR